MEVYEPGKRYLLASSAGKGFIAKSDDMIASTKNGRQVLNPPKDSRAVVFREVQEGATHIAVTGTSRKLLVFPIDQISEMKKGQGTTLQKYKDGQLTDAKAINVAEGLSWLQGENRTRTEEDLTSWLGNRAGAGKLPPQGFPRDNKF